MDNANKQQQLLQLMQHINSISMNYIIIIIQVVALAPGHSLCYLPCAIGGSDISKDTNQGFSWEQLSVCGHEPSITHTVTVLCTSTNSHRILS